MSKVLLVASAGGHWEQLMLLLPSFQDHQLVFVSTMAGLAESAGVGATIVIHDCNRDRRAAMVRCALQLWSIVRSERPEIVVSTGAAPGLLALIIGKLFGARSVWIDSVANAERLSMSGLIAGKVADVWLTQWRHLAAPKGPHYIGTLL
jgi:UDP-N-acetylglucosamine:LPS N-acetylglucosamine transferase